MPTAATRVLLVVTSFAPLWLGLGILEYPGGGWTAVPLYVLAVLSPVALRTYLRSVRRIATTKETVTSANRREQELVAYVASYLVPFAFVSIDGWRPKTVLAIFLLLIVGLATHARIYYVNPLLAVARYHVYEVVFDTGSTVTLITRRTHLPAGAELAVRTLDNDVYLANLLRGDGFTPQFGPLSQHFGLAKVPPLSRPSIVTRRLDSAREHRPSRPVPAYMP